MEPEGKGEEAWRGRRPGSWVSSESCPRARLEYSQKEEEIKMANFLADPAFAEEGGRGPPRAPWPFIAAVGN